MTAISRIPGWTFTDLGSLGRWGSGGTPSRSTSAYYEGGDIPWLVIGDLNERVVIRAQNAITKLGLENSSAKLLPPGTLLVAMYGSIGKTSVTGVACATNQAIAYCIPHPAVNLRYLHLAVQWVKPVLIAQGQGGAQQNISQGILKAQTIPLAPEREQRRIADKLDTVLTRVDAVNTRLARVAPILKRFRQSVLAAATSGRLTEDWRSSTGASITDWEMIPVSDACTKITDGEHITPALASEGVPLISAKDVREWGVDFSETKFVSEEFANTSRRRCDPSLGDVLVVSRGATVGRTCFVTEDRLFCLMGSVLLFKPDASRVLPKFLAIFLASPVGLEQLTSASGATAQAAIYIRDAKNLPVSLGSLEEQTEIVRRVETLFAFADRLEARLQTAKTATERLTPALLAKAFRGELVPQDPNDEPASELLRRLQQEAPPNQTKRGRKSAA